MSTATAPTLAPGLHRDVPMADYLALDAMSGSKLEKLRRSPLQYRYAEIEAEEEASDALDRGTALHLAILEPALFDGRYVTIGQCEGRKKGDGLRCTYQGSVYRAGKSFCKTHDPDAGEPQDPAIHVLKQDDYDAVTGMRDAVLAHPRASTLFEGAGEFEATVVWEDEETGVLCKARPDRLIERAGMHVSLKSCRDASPWFFPGDAERRGYFRSVAFYRRGLRAIGWPYEATTVLAVESCPPFDLITYLALEEDLDDADREVTRLLREYRRCAEDNHWPGYDCGPSGLLELRRPAWARDNNDLEDFNG